MSELKYLGEFQTLLSNYHVSDETKRLLKEVNIVLLVAPTSSGRNTIIRHLQKTGDYHYLVSDTTRDKRVNDGVPERDGVEYWFRTEEQVLADLRAGRYLEAAIIHGQQVSGMSLRELKAAHDEGKIAVTDIEIVGVETMKRLKPDVRVIFVLPPSFEEWQRRIVHRGKMSDSELKRRMQSAYNELGRALEHDYLIYVVNDNLDQACEQINSIAHLGEIDPAEQARGRHLAEQLHIQTKHYLTKGLHT